VRELLHHSLTKLWYRFCKRSVVRPRVYSPYRSTIYCQ